MTFDVDNRPTFTCQMGQIRAGGVLYYHFNLKKGCVEYLFAQYRNNIFEDFGGKTEKCDYSIEDTVAREVSEESNNVFCKHKTKCVLEKNKFVYLPSSKYCVYFIKLNHRIDEHKFDVIEKHLGYKRTVHWISSDQIHKNMLHPRLRSKHIVNKFKNLQKRFNQFQINIQYQNDMYETDSPTLLQTCHLLNEKSIQKDYALSNVISA